jgi:hypothetical protein
VDRGDVPLARAVKEEMNTKVADTTLGTHLKNYLESPDYQVI